MSPVELNSVARSLGALDVLYRAQTRGYTRWGDTGPTLILALTRSDGRRRATLAHECGHLVVDPIAQTDSFLQMSQPQQEQWKSKISSCLGEDVVSQLAAAIERDGVERVCDVLSHELLLPAVWAREIRKAWSGDVGGLREVAEQHRLSLSMTFIRLNEISPDHTLLMLRATPLRKWIVVRPVGAPKWMAARIECVFDPGHEVPFSGERQIPVRIQTATVSRWANASVVCAGSSRIMVIARADLELGELAAVKRSPDQLQFQHHAS